MRNKFKEKPGATACLFLIMCLVIGNFAGIIASAGNDEIQETENTTIKLTGNEFTNRVNFSDDTNTSGVFNRVGGRYLLAASGDLSERYCTANIYVPRSGIYYVGARMRTAATPVTQINYHLNRSVRVSFIQNDNERFVTGTKPWSADNTSDFDSHKAGNVNQYLFGTMRDFVGALASYNYTDAQPIYLDEGETTVKLYGNSYARMDFLVISDVPMQDISTKAQYESTYEVYENPCALLFEEQPAVSVNSDNETILSFAVSGGHNLRYELYDKTTNEFLYESKDNFFDLSRISTDETLFLGVRAYDAYNNNADSSATEFSVTYRDTNIIISNALLFSSVTCPYSGNIPTCSPEPDISNDTFNADSGYCWHLNHTGGEVLKYTRKIFVPESGTYYVSSRNLTEERSNVEDPRIGTFQVSFSQKNKEKFVGGQKGITMEDDVAAFGEYDSLISDGVNKYLYGAQRDFVAGSGYYLYTDAQPVELEKGFAYINVYAYPNAKMDYIAITERKPRANLNKKLYDLELSYSETVEKPEFSGDVTYSVTEDACVVEYPHCDNAEYALYGIGSGGNYTLLDYGEEGSTSIVSDKLYNSSYNSVSLVCFNKQGKFTEKKLNVQTPKTTIILTPANNFVVNEDDAAKYPDNVWNYSFAGCRDIYNNSGRGVLLATNARDFNEIKQAVRMETRIYVPHSGSYKISARAGTSSDVADELIKHERVFGVTITQGNTITEVGGNPDNTFILDSSRCEMPGNLSCLELYGFGMKRDFVTSEAVSCYNYDDANWVYLREGEATITVYGLGYCRMDYLAITDYELDMPETKSEYDRTLAMYEDVNLPYFLEEPCLKTIGYTDFINASVYDPYDNPVNLSIYICNGKDRTLQANITGNILKTSLDRTENIDNSEICIRAETSFGSFKEVYLTRTDKKMAEYLYDEPDKERYFEYFDDYDFYKLETSIFPSDYIISFSSDVTNSGLEIYMAEDNKSTYITSLTDGEQYILHSDGRKSEKEKYYLKAVSGDYLGAYKVNALQIINELEPGRIVKSASEDESVFLSVSVGQYTGTEDIMYTICYDPYQLELEDAILDIGKTNVYEDSDVEIYDQGFGYIKFKYTGTNSHENTVWRQIMHVLKFVSKIRGHVNFKYQIEEQVL